MAQHGVLLRILNVYADLAHRLQAGAADIDTIALMEAAQLFRDFGEDYHERMLEEEYVFPELSEAGGPNAKLAGVRLSLRGWIARNHRRRASPVLVKRNR